MATIVVSETFTVLVKLSLIENTLPSNGRVFFYKIEKTKRGYINVKKIVKGLT